MAQQAYMTETDNGGSGPEHRGPGFGAWSHRLSGWLARRPADLAAGPASPPRSRCCWPW